MTRYRHNPDLTATVTQRLLKYHILVAQEEFPSIFIWPLSQENTPKNAEKAMFSDWIRQEVDMQ